MKKIFLYLIFIVLVLGIHLLNNSPFILKNEEKKAVELEGFYSIDSGQILISFFEGKISHFYDPKIQNTIYEIAQKNNLSLAINGGFFLPNKSFAGLLYQDKEIKSKISYDDPQVTQLVYVDFRDNIFFRSIEEFDPEELQFFKIVFQTGPIFLKDNIFQENYVNISLNGNSYHLRSFWGVTSKDRKFLGITLKQYNLKDLSERLLKSSIFSNENISVVNLDGGSSVSVFSKDYPELNYGLTKKVPSVIGILSE